MMMIKILFLEVSFLGIPAFQYYVSHQYILIEVTDIVHQHKKHYTLLDVANKQVHHINEPRTHRWVEPWEPSSGRIKSTSTKKTLVRISEPYLKHGVECVDHHYEFTNDTFPEVPPRHYVRNYCKIPLIEKYFKNREMLSCLASAFDQEEGGDYPFLIRSYFEDGSDSGALLNKVEETTVPGNFFAPYLAVPECSKEDFPE